jgi:hypothetical protein
VENSPVQANNGVCRLETPLDSRGQLGFQSCFSNQDGGYRFEQDNSVCFVSTDLAQTGYLITHDSAGMAPKKLQFVTDTTLDNRLVRCEQLCYDRKNVAARSLSEQRPDVSYWSPYRHYHP